MAGSLGSYDRQNEQPTTIESTGGFIEELNF